MMSMLEQIVVRSICTTQTLLRITFSTSFGLISVLPSRHFRSFRARSVTLTTLFLGKPPRQFTTT